MTQEKSQRGEPEEPAAENPTAERAWWSGCGCSHDQFRELIGAESMASCESLMSVSRFPASQKSFAGCCGPKDPSKVETPSRDAASEPEAAQPG